MAMKSEEINRWHTLIALSEEERKEKQPLWELFERYFRGLQWDLDPETNKDIITVNLVYSHVKIVIPSIYYRNPKIYFEPNKASSVDRAKLTEFILNRDIQATKMKYTNKDILQDVLVLGTGWSKTTYEIEDETELYDITEEGEIIENEFNNVSGGPVKDRELFIPENGPRIVRVSPYDIGTAVGATDPEDPGFISHHVRKRLRDVKRDRYYKNTKDLQPTAVASDKIRSKYSATWNTDTEDYLQMVDLYEIWNPEINAFCVIAKGHDKPLVDWQDNPYKYVHPFDRLVFTKLKDQIWGLSEIEPWLPQVDELNKLRTQHMQHTKRYARKYIALEHKLADEEQRQRLEDGEDGVVVMVRGENVNNAIGVLQDAPLPPDQFALQRIVADDIVRIGGIPSYRRGEQAGANTATEANITEKGAEIRDSDRIDNIAEFILNQMEKIRIARRQYTPGTQVIKMTGDITSVQTWVDWQKEDIDIHSDMRIEYGSTLPINQERRKQDSILLYDRALANPTVNPMSAFSNLLEAFDVRDQTAWFLPKAIIQLQLLQKALGAQQEGKGISPTAPIGREPGPATAETAAELRGRATATG